MKRDKLENYVIVFLSIGLILFVAFRLNIFESIASQIEKETRAKNIEAWLKNATNENLKENVLAIEGRNYIFISGNLSSKCTNFDPYSHCPISVLRARVNGDKLFLENFRFATPDPNIFPYPLEEGVKFLGLLEKGQEKNITLDFEILDYIPNKDLCKKPHSYNNTLCDIRWNKSILLNETDKSDKNLTLDVENFNYSFLNQTLEIFLNGKIGSDERPKVVLSFYKIFNSYKSLMNESVSDLQYKNGIYAFELKNSFDLGITKQNQSILLLVTGNRSFIAKEWVFDKNGLIETKVYD